MTDLRDHCHLHLSDGTPAVTRAITHADGVALQRGLGRLSPTAQVFRFLSARREFSEEELHYLTHCDFTDHIALILAIHDGEGRETDQVGVARCVRTQEDPEMAEVAIVLVDEYQGLGGGVALLRHLARLAWRSGVRRWQGFFFVENVAVGKLLAHLGGEVSRRSLGQGLCEVVYELFPPSDS